MDLINELRFKKRDLTLHQLSVKLDIDITTLSNWINGKHKPNKGSLLRIAEKINTL
jgi:transcriptional regulator with XRE-family HTH domain